MDPLISLLTQYNWMISVPIVAFLLLAFASPYGKIHGDQATSKYHVGNLIQSGGKNRYNRMMRKALGWLDERLSPREIAASKSPANVAWSTGLISTAMLLAVVYPILSFVSQWLAGSELTFGGSILIPAGTPIARIFTIFWLGIPIFLNLFGVFVKPRWRFQSFILAIGVLTSVLFISDNFGVPAEIAFAVAVAFAVAFAVTGAVAFAFAVTGAFAFAFAVTGAVAVALAFSGAVAGAVALAVAVGYFDKKFKTALVFVVFLAVLLCIYTGTAVWFWQPADVGLGPYIFTFFAILPVFNALADFASIGLTRYLLRKGLDGLTWIQAIIDAFGGLLIFLFLGCTLITYFHLVQTPDGPLLNIAGLFTDLEQRPGDMWWLAFMLGSTLLPTLIHLAIGTATLLLQYPAPLRGWIVAKLESGQHGIETDGWQGSMAICAMIVTSFWLPILAFYFLLTANHSWLIKQVIAIFKTYAQVIGAAP